MRVSPDITDPGYLFVKLARLELGAIRVFLNGREIRDVITADEEAGIVVIYSRGLDGRYIVTGPVCATEMLHGEVRIVTTINEERQTIQ